jgi:uncharacterized Zn-finger protein
MGGEKRRTSLVSLLLLSLLLGPLPTAQAQSGSLLIETASIGLENYSTHLNSTLEFTFEVHELDGQNGNASAEVHLQSPEGESLSNTTVSVPAMSGLDQVNLTATVLGLPYGYSHITVVLTGDVGENTTTHTTSFTRVVQRLRPLNISFGGSSSVLGDAVDENGSLIGNTTLSDGDRVRFEFPVINHGDVDWTGDVNMHLVNNDVHTNITLTDVLVNATESLLLTVAPDMVLSEGTLSWRLNLSGNLSEAGGLHTLEGSFEVGPPPLPFLSMELSSNAASVEAGDTLTLAVTVWNNGTMDFSGRLVCTIDGSEALNESFAVSVGENTSSTMSVTAKPLLVQCGVIGQRIDEASPLPVTLVVDVPSAVFEAAGSSSPSYSGGPWHEGDRLSGNMLLRNTGGHEGRVRLGFTIVDISYPGEWVSLSDGAAGEVSAEAPFLSSGEQTVSWWLESDDGVVEGLSTGVASFSIAPKQSVTLEIVDVERSTDGSVEGTLTVELDEGRSREVVLRTGYETGDATVFLREQSLILEPGVLTQSMFFGEIEAERLIASVTAVDWNVGPGPLAARSTLPSDVTEYWMTFDTTTQPLRPLVGDRVTVTLTFHQSGPQSEQRGELWLVDAYGSLLTQATTPVWGGSSEVSVPLEVTWPKGSTVALRAVWSIDGESVVEDTSYISGQAVVKSDFDLPLGAIAWGAALGVALVLGARLRFRTQVSAKSTKASMPGTSTRDTAAPTKEKREVTCPSCDRRLRVPVDYTGSVGCPDCSTKFTVEAEASVPATEAEESTPSVNETPPPKKEKSDGKIEVACPDCDQTLRIPGSYRGSVRCPACTKIFKADQGATMIE